METNQAAEHLQVIRTLMERSALYRRALAPIMTFAGIAGILGAGTGWFLGIGSGRGFVTLWVGVAVIALGGTLLLVRRQAFRDSEPFWSPPTRRIAQALLPGFFVGMLVALPFILFDSRGVRIIGWLPVVWAMLYGIALHSAGFFVARGFRLFGWVLVISGCSLFIVGVCVPWFLPPLEQAHVTMGILFGLSHLAYGIYLYFTENRKTAP